MFSPFFSFLIKEWILFLGFSLVNEKNLSSSKLYANMDVNQGNCSYNDEEDVEEDFTIGRDKGEMLVLTSFSLPIADIEVDVDWSGESLVAIRRDLHQERSL